MENDNLNYQEILDDDIMQCRADILRNRTRAQVSSIENIADQTDSDNPVKRTDVTAKRIRPGNAGDNAADNKTAESKVRIPHFEDLVSTNNQVVDALWESPEKVEPQPSPQEEKTQQVDTPEIGFELDPENIVTTEEEQALLGESQAPEPVIEDTQMQTETSDEGLEELRKIIAEAKNQAQPEIEKLEDIDNIISDGDIRQIDESKACEDTAEETNDTETMSLTDLAEPEQPDRDLSAQTAPADNTNIPKFDLAEQILKEQRQVASKRRKRPAGAGNINVMPIAGTVGRIIENARKAVAAAAEKNESPPETNPAIAPQEITEPETADFDSIEIEIIKQDHAEPVLSAADCRVINEFDRLNPFQEDINVDIVSRDIARFCGQLSTASC